MATAQSIPAILKRLKSVYGGTLIDLDEIEKSLQRALAFGSLNKTIICRPEDEADIRHVLEEHVFRSVEVLSTKMVPDGQMVVFDRDYIDEPSLLHTATYDISRETDE